tara:strand:+ start:146 stop:250 length:105 start_codon:yes stop_codon:yes gene_type:complete
MEEDRRGKYHRIEAVYEAAVPFDRVTPILDAPVA